MSLITGWIVFAIALVVYYFSAERTGSLWDCGEFVLGAYKLQVVHPPGAPLFLIIGRLFTWIADVLSNDPQDIAFAVNLMSGVCTALAAAMVAWTTIVFARLSMVGRDQVMNTEQILVACGAGLAAGLATAFSTSIWFSAVEGEVYAMSTMFTTLTLWAAAKWYGMEDTPDADRWIVLAIYVAGLSIGVHLLSLLVFPAMGLLYYFKKYKTFNFGGLILAMILGAMIIPVVQNLIIVGVPSLWSKMELLMVNSFGMPIHSGIFPTLLILGAASFFGLRWARKNNNGLAERLIVSLVLLVISFSTIGVVIIRANANTPINMNAPSDAMRLIPYLNREQYGERPLLRGPHFEADPIDTEKEDRYGIVGDRYEVVDHKLTYIYRDEDKILLPRISHSDGSRPALYKRWMGDEKGTPTMAFNLEFLFRYQINWMYWRYFMWNFVGKQNGEQGYMPSDKTKGNWLSGISFIDDARLGSQELLPSFEKNNQSRNTYYFIPFLLGLIGCVFHYKKRNKDWLGLSVLFLITGIGIIVYSNQPPIEPRERDYVLVGSFFTFCIWIGLGALAIGKFIADKVKANRMIGYTMGGVLGLLSPLLMVSQNMDDMGRKGIYASRDYASNFLNSVAKNAIIFTYGDNDTYPLWYAQEVENIRPDVRVINLSLIAVDWYIDQQRRKINQSDAIKMTIPPESYRGNKRNQVYYVTSQMSEQELPASSVLQFIGESHPLEGSNSKQESFLPTNKIYIPIDKAKMLSKKYFTPSDSILDRIPVSFNVKEQGDYIVKGDLAVLDIVASNINDRPVYFSVTADPAKFMGLGQYMQLEGLALRVVPIRTEPDRQFGVFGMGRVASDSLYNNVINKFKWGNFDTKRLYVDKSYTPSINAMRMIQMRGAYDLINKKDKKRAADLAENTLKVFPNKNFPFDGTIIPALALVAQASNLDRAKPYMKTLAENMREKMIYYNSLTPSELSQGHQGDFEDTKKTINDLMDIIRQNKDPKFEAEIMKIVGPMGSNVPANQLLDK